MLDGITIVKPEEIEKRSMEIITSELGGRTWPEDEFLVVKRCIHTAADFDYADNLVFSAKWGGSVRCFMADESVAAEAKEKGVTRASICMERGAELTGPVIFAVGNAPTALIRLYEMIQNGETAPVLIIGAPVGFVNVVESKELILSASVPHIVARGRKGGSNIAAAICNAILYQCGR